MKTQIETSEEEIHQPEVQPAPAISMEDAAIAINKETQVEPKQESAFKNTWIDAYSDCV